MTTILCKGGWTGQKIHRASPGSSCTRCGHWLKASASYFKVAEDTPEARERLSPTVMCEKCFPQLTSHKETV
jgi:hypothetical protein